MRRLLMVTLLLIHGTASSAPLFMPTLDDTVRAFMAAPALFAEGRLPILLRYRQSFRIENELTPASLMMNLRLFNKQQEQRVLDFLSADPLAKPHSLWLVNGSLLRVNQEQLGRLAADPRIQSISWSGRRSFLLNEENREGAAVRSSDLPYGLEKIGLIQLMKQNPELNGKGIRIGIIDTGVNVEHPDLAGKVRAFRDFSYRESDQPFDDHGHGSHVSGTMVGGSESGAPIGIAPGAELVAAKAFSKYGSTTDEILLKSMQWMADPDSNPKTSDAPHVVNNSWGNTDPFSSLDPADNVFCAATRTWFELGIIPVAAAGNEGPSDETINVPAACPEVIAVASTDDVDEVSSFSSRGNARWKSATLEKPELAAPGSTIRSADLGKGYRYRSGTSMASPHVSGAVALLLQFKPGLDFAGVKRILAESALDLGASGQDTDYGAGRLRLPEMIETAAKQ